MPSKWLAKQQSGAEGTEEAAEPAEPTQPGLLHWAFLACVLVAVAGTCIGGCAVHAALCMPGSRVRLPLVLPATPRPRRCRAMCVPHAAPPTPHLHPLATALGGGAAAQSYSSTNSASIDWTASGVRNMVRLPPGLAAVAAGCPLKPPAPHA